MCFPNRTVGPIDISGPATKKKPGPPPPAGAFNGARPPVQARGISLSSPTNPICVKSPSFSKPFALFHRSGSARSRPRRRHRCWAIRLWHRLGLRPIPTFEKSERKFVKSSPPRLSGHAWWQDEAHHSRPEFRSSSSRHCWRLTGSVGLLHGVVAVRARPRHGTHPHQSPRSHPKKSLKFYL